MPQLIRISTIAALTATASLVASPVAALDQSVREAPAIATGVTNQAGWGWGWGGGYGRGRHHDDGIGVGDVLAGVLILGTIAAIADADDDEDDRRREQRERDEEDRARRDAQRNDRSEMRGNYESSRGIDSAVGICVEQVEKGSARVGSVDNAARAGDGWHVSGALESGPGWSCWIDNDGRIRSVDLALDGSELGTAPAGNGQLSDEAYAQARAMHGTAPVARTAVAASGTPAAQPAYPGGPLPGEEGFEESEQLTSAS